MKKTFKKLICLLLCVCLTACGLTFAASSEAQVDPESMDERCPGWEEFCYAPHAQGIAPYKFNTMNIYTDFEAEMIDLPEGYTGYVMVLNGGPELGFTVDFSDLHILLTSVKALHFRVYYPANTKEVRATIDGGHGWTMRYVAKSPDTWDDVVLDDMTQLKKMCNDDGTLGLFGFGVRFLDGTGRDNTVYIDAIEVELIPGDDVPPVLTYDGPTEINWTAGKPLRVDATAYDEYEKTAMPITYEWDEGALDADGLPKEGDHVCAICSCDSFGNKSEIKLTVHVGPADTEAPKIAFRAVKIKTYAGTRVDSLVIPATDNTDAVTTVNEWSEGAIDVFGHLTAGTHTLTVTSTDLTGNTSTITVTVEAE